MRGLKVLSGLLAGTVCCLYCPGNTQETTTEIKTSTTTTKVVTETVVKEKKHWQPFKVCVLDFTTIDIEAQKKFLDHQNKPIVIPPQSTLNDEDRKSMNSIMQGFVRMIDAWDNTKTNDANRKTQVQDNQFSRAKAMELYKSIAKTSARPTVIGADYLAAYLGKYNEVFSLIDSSLMVKAMQQLENSPDFPQDFMLRLAKLTGATHLIYGTVSDLRSRSVNFSGYGIEVKNIVYELDVTVKMVDLVAQRTAYSNVYTGSYREQQKHAVSAINSDIFQTLMKNTLETVAEDFYNACRPGRKNKVTATPLTATEK